MKTPETPQPGQGRTAAGLDRVIQYNAQWMLNILEDVRNQQPAAGEEWQPPDSESWKKPDEA